VAALRAVYIVTSIYKALVSIRKHEWKKKKTRLGRKRRQTRRLGPFSSPLSNTLPVAYYVDYTYIYNKT
jgi:hypothetical protein